MGLMDPKLNKDRTFELLRKKGAVEAILEFEGGHDEGSVQSIALTLKSGEVVGLPTWYCGGYRIGDKQEDGSYEYIPLSTPANEDEELADLLEGPINNTFGAWGGQPSTNGTLIWDVKSKKAKLAFTQEEVDWRDYEEVI